MKTLIVLACLLALAAHFEASKSGSGSKERRYWGRYRPQPAYYPSYARNPYNAQMPFGYPAQYPYFAPNFRPSGYPSYPQYFYVFVPVNSTAS